jgi:c-di-GMP-binding flagellar brake protein YcgR
VFKTDEVTDPAESLQSTELLDRHFKRAYQTITGGKADARRKDLVEPLAARPSTAKPPMTTDIQERLALLFSTRNILDNSGVTSTRQIAEDTDMVIKAGKESYPSRVLSANRKNLVVENPLDAEGEPVKLERNSKVVLSFFTQSDKEFSVETQVLGIKEPGEEAKLYLAHSNRIQYRSNRQFRRRQMGLSADIYPVRLEEEKMVADKKKLAGKIMDISIGGCSIQTSTSIASGSRLKIEFSPNAALKAAALGQVLRTNQNGTNTVMHVKFLKVPHRSMNAINALVFEYSNR